MATTSEALVLSVQLNGSTISMKVVRQNSGLIRRGDYRFVAADGFVIKSDVDPELVDRAAERGRTADLFIRGTEHEQDTTKCERRFGSRPAALEYLRRLKAAVKELNASFVPAGETVQ